MRHNECQQAITNGVHLRRPDVAAAKGWLVRNRFVEPRGAVERWVESLGHARGQPTVHMDSGDLAAECARVAERLSLRLAGHLAVWELVHASRLLPAGGVRQEEGRVAYKGSRGSGGWKIDRATVTYLDRVLLVPPDQGEFTDGDLYLTRLAVPDLHEGVAEALRDAVACFRADLFTPCVAMLGAALEGAWIELGDAMLPVFASGSSGPKYTQALHGQSGFSEKIETILKMWGQNPLKPVRRASEITVDRLRQSAEWTHEVRRSRNVLHWGVETHTPNNYDKVATLMLTLPSHLRLIYSARSATTAFVTANTTAAVP